MFRPVRVFAPVSVGNAVAGFDALGLAVKPLDGTLWGDIVEVRENRERNGVRLSLKVSGAFRDKLPKDPRKNLVYFVAEEFLRRLRSRRKSIPKIQIILEKRLPICSGLGSSGSSAAASAFALNTFFKRPFSHSEIFALAAHGEHRASGSDALDNVAPALFGGLCLVRDQASQGVVHLSWPKDLLLVLVTPEHAISTRRARKMLPKKIPLRSAIRYWKNLALFVAGCEQGDRELIAASFHDTLIEPIRSRLLPGFRRAQSAAVAAGALGCSLSGSGPTNVALVPNRVVGNRVLKALRLAYRKAGIPSNGRLVQVDLRGARVLS